MRTVPAEMPLVSVIVTTFNRRSLVRETIASILAQSFADFELLVVDNDSRDGTEQTVLEMADARIRYFRNANRGIIATNRNFGIARARGRYISFCDDDDLWHREKLMRQIRFLGEHPDTAVVGTNATLFDGYRRYGPMLRHVPFKTIGASMLLCRRNPVILSSVVALKTAITGADCFREELQFKAVEDLDLWIRIALGGGRVRVMNQTLVLYRIHPAQESNMDARSMVEKERLILARIRRMRLIPTFMAVLASACGTFRFWLAAVKEASKKLLRLKKTVYMLKALRHGFLWRDRP